MKGLTVTKKVVLPVQQTKAGELLSLVLLVVVCLVLVVPLLAIAGGAILFDSIRTALNPDRDKEKGRPADSWHPISTYGSFTLHRRTVEAASISEHAYEYFDSEPLSVYKTAPSIDFFDGYFSDFKVARTDGIFVQKVFFNTVLDEVLSMPLYFFKYGTQEAEEIHDLKDYTLETRGNPNDFLLTASGAGEELQFHIQRTKP